MASARDPVRERWAAGEVALNAWLSLEGASSASLVSAAGFDAATVDLQHGAASLETLSPIVAAIASSGALPLARVPWNDPAGLMRGLDLGVRGVICPMVDSADEARAFVRACRYPPDGARSYGPIRSAFGTGREHTDAANQAVLLFAQIETAAGLSGVEEICATPGLDGVYVGPADLSLTLGLETFADLSDARLLEALDRILAAAAAGWDRARDPRPVGRRRGRDGAPGIPLRGLRRGRRAASSRSFDGGRTDPGRPSDLARAPHRPVVQ